jgi:DNA-binding MarR family transcriptional regulator
MSDFTHGKGVAAFGTRLRRLSERLDRDVQALYRESALDFEPRWFAVITALHERGPATVGELAEGLGVTHAAVSQVRAALAARGLVRGGPDPRDLRRQIVRLTSKGRGAVARLAPLWAAVTAATTELCDEAPGLLAALADLEAALARRGLAARARDRLPAPRRAARSKC